MADERLCPHLATGEPIGGKLCGKPGVYFKLWRVPDTITTWTPKGFMLLIPTGTSREYPSWYCEEHKDAAR